MLLKRHFINIILIICLIVAIGPFAVNSFADAGEEAVIAGRESEPMSLEQAIEEVEDDGKIKLLKDVELEDTLEVDAGIGKELSVDLMGKRILNHTTTPTLMIKSGKLLLANGKIENTIGTGIELDEDGYISFSEGEGGKVTIVSKGDPIGGIDTNATGEFTYKASYTITGQAVPSHGGTVSAPTEPVEEGTNVNYTVSPAEGFAIDKIEKDGVLLENDTPDQATAGVFQADGNSTVKATFKLKEYASIAASQNNPDGGKIEGALDGIIAGTSPSITVKVAKGYTLADLLIDDVSVGSKASYTFDAIEGNHKVEAVFKKDQLYVMLDAGHFGRYGQSKAYPSYYESNMTWTLHVYLKEELEKYQNVAVGVTRPDKARDLNVYDRGTAAKGCDLFLSLHSGTESHKDYPLVVVQKDGTKDPLAEGLGEAIENTMETARSYKIEQKLNSDKKTEFYGVLRGSKAVGAKGMILQHSYHSSLACAKWLSNNTNLRKLAQMEAQSIAKYYGLTKTGSDTIKPLVPQKVKATRNNYNTLTVNWNPSAGAAGYEVSRSTSKTGGYKKIADVKGGTKGSYKNTGLKTGTTYHYKVKSYRGADKRYSRDSNAASGKAILIVPKLSAVAKKGLVTLKWKKAAGTSGYVVYRANSKTGSYKAIKTLKSSASYKDKKVKKGKKYYYKLKAYRTVSGKRIYSSFSNRSYVKAK